MSGFPLPETGLPGLRPLLDGDLWGRWSSRGWVPPLDCPRKAVRYIRLKPGTSCRLTVFPRWGLRDSLPTGWRIEFYPDAARARHAHDKEQARAESVFIDEAHAAVGVAFPQDRELRSLRHVARSFRLRETLALSLFDFDPARQRIRRTDLRTTLLAYKPGRRAVFELRGTACNRDGGHPDRFRLIAKWMKPEIAAARMERLAAIATCLNRGEYALVPRLLGGDPARGLNLIDRVEGRKLQRTGGDEAVLRRAGELLASIHAGPTERAGKRLPVAMGHANLGRLAHDFACLAPGLDSRLHRVAERLSEVEDPGTPVPIHGDLHLGQILAGTGENRHSACRLIDWDQAGAGSRYRDLGSLLAHAWVAGSPAGYAEEFLDAYRGAFAGRETVSPNLLEPWTAKMLFLRLADGFRHLEPDWPSRMERSLGEVERRLNPEKSHSQAQL